jgi:hypothetical protein
MRTVNRCATVLNHHLPGTILSVPLSDESEYTVMLEDPPQQYFVPIGQITGEGKPTFQMMATDNTEPGEAPPKVPDWIQENTHVTVHHEGKQLRGLLQSTDRGW